MFSIVIVSWYVQLGLISTVCPCVAGTCRVTRNPLSSSA
uniref:Uncharacterized protein n=1 Tax=Arundo donax TaxID=35708 RepID=A0A0A9G943_ARUDO